MLAQQACVAEYDQLTSVISQILALDVIHLLSHHQSADRQHHGDSELNHHQCATESCPPAIGHLLFQRFNRLEGGEKKCRISSSKQCHQQKHQSNGQHHTRLQ